MIKPQRNIFRKFFYNLYMFPERLDEVIFIKDIAKFAESMKTHPHETPRRILSYTKW
jgi:hypothetical protein